MLAAHFALLCQSSTLGNNKRMSFVPYNHMLPLFLSFYEPGVHSRCNWLFHLEPGCWLGLPLSLKHWPGSFGVIEVFPQCGQNLVSFTCHLLVDYWLEAVFTL